MRDRQPITVDFKISGLTTKIYPLAQLLVSQLSSI